MTENNNTIAQVVNDGLCTGCGTCIALCPEEAIKLTINEKKGLYAQELEASSTASLMSKSISLISFIYALSYFYQSIFLLSFGYEDRCNNCGGYNVCPGHEVDFKN